MTPGKVGVCHPSGGTALPRLRPSFRSLPSLPPLSAGHGLILSPVPARRYGRPGASISALRVQIADARADRRSAGIPARDLREEQVPTQGPARPPACATGHRITPPRRTCRCARPPRPHRNAPPGPIRAAPGPPGKTPTVLPEPPPHRCRRKQSLCAANQIGSPLFPQNAHLRAGGRRPGGGPIGAPPFKQIIGSPHASAGAPQFST